MGLVGKEDLTGNGGATRISVDAGPCQTHGKMFLEGSDINAKWWHGTEGDRVSHREVPKTGGSKEAPLHKR